MDVSVWMGDKYDTMCVTTSVGNACKSLLLQCLLSMFYLGNK